MRSAAHDAVVLTKRSLRHIGRSPDTIITTAITPIAMLLLFVYVFGGAIRTGAGGGTGAYTAYVLPGIMVMTVGSGVAYTAYRMFLDVSNGIVERFQSMPIARSAFLWSHVLTSLIANVISLVLVVLVALVMGFRTAAGPLDWLGVAGLLLLFTLALTWLAIIPGLGARSADGVSGFSYPLVFAPFVSSAFVPTASMPAPVRWFAEKQPVTPIVDTIRGLWGGDAVTAVGNAWWIAVLWCCVLLVVAHQFAMRAYRRRVGGRR